MIGRVGPLKRRWTLTWFLRWYTKSSDSKFPQGTETIWQRMRDAFGCVDADAVLAAGADGLQAFGISFRKADQT